MKTDLYKPKVYSMAVGELKARFSEVIEEVKKGKEVGILYGKAKKPVALIIPYPKNRKKERKIGILDGKINIEFKDDFAMSGEELLDPGLAPQ